MRFKAAGQASLRSVPKASTLILAVGLLAADRMRQLLEQHELLRIDPGRDAVELGDHVDAGQHGRRDRP